LLRVAFLTGVIGVLLATFGVIAAQTPIPPAPGGRTAAPTISTRTPTRRPPPSVTPAVTLPGFPSRPIQFGDSITGVITIPNASDRYSFFAPFGTLITIGMFSTVEGSSFAPAFDVYAPNGAIIFNAKGGKDALVSAGKATSSGVYVIYARAATPNGIGGYRLSLGEGAVLRELDGETLKLDTPVKGQITARGDRQRWTIQVRAGVAFQVIAQPLDRSPLDPVIEVIAPSGERVALAHDTSNANSAVTAPITVNVAGVYQIFVTGYLNESAGTYDLITQTVRRTPTPVVVIARANIPPIKLSLEGSVEQGATYSAIFNGISGQTVSVTVQGKNGFDPVVEVYGPSGRRAAVADDTPIANDMIPDSTLTVVLNDGDGVYSVRVSGYALLPGAFLLTIETP
jgi:hypothetical protein